MTHTHEYHSHLNKVKATFLYALLWLVVALFIALIGFPKDGTNWFYIALVAAATGVGIWKLYRGGKAKKEFDEWKAKHAELA